MSGRDLVHRAGVHAALGDPTRLAIVDELGASDRSPVELRRLTGLESNLLAHHLDVLAGVGLVTRWRSSGDRRRRYVHLESATLPGGGEPARFTAQPVVFVCTHNTARSQLAAALWSSITSAPANSAGTHPAGDVHPGAVDAARRAGLDLSRAAPRALAEMDVTGTLVVTVCDRAHEELDPPASWLHWSVADPVATPTSAAFDRTVAELRQRITLVVGKAS